MSVATWGLLYALMPLGQSPPIETMNFQPAISKSDCINQSKPYWYDYHHNQNKKKVSLYTYCLWKKANYAEIIDVVCDSAGGCSERLR
jgi:hypothetical protein